MARIPQTEYLVMNSKEEFEDFVYENKINFSKKIVQIIFDYVDTDHEILDVYVIKIKSNKENIIISVKRRDFAESLHKNLKIFEDLEEYETCQKIIETIDYLDRKDLGLPTNR